MTVEECMNRLFSDEDDDDDTPLVLKKKKITYSRQSKPSSKPRKEYDKPKTYEEDDTEAEFSEEYSYNDGDDDGDDDDEDAEPKTDEEDGNKRDDDDDEMGYVESENDDDGREVRNITEKDGKPTETIVLHNQLSAETGKRVAPASTSKTPAEKKAKMTDFEPGSPPADTRDDRGDHSDDRNPAAYPDQPHSMIVVNPPPESTQGEDLTTIDGAVALRDVDPSESTLLEFSIKMKKDWITMQDVMPVLKTVLGAYEAPYSTIRKRTGQMIQGCLHILKKSQHLEMSKMLASRNALVAARDAAINERNYAIAARDEAAAAGDSAKVRLKEAEESIEQLRKKEVELRHVVKFCRDEEAEAKVRAEEMLAVLKRRDDKIAQLEKALDAYKAGAEKGADASEKHDMSRSDRIRSSASDDKVLVAKAFNLKEE